MKPIKELKNGDYFLFEGHLFVKTKGANRLVKSYSLGDVSETGRLSLCPNPCNLFYFDSDDLVQPCHLKVELD